MTRALRWLVWMAIGVSACGQIRIVGDDAAILPDDVAGDAGSDTAGDSAGDSSTDAVGNDTAGGCQTDDDCKGIKGKTPCKYPICVKATGLCKLQLRSVGDLCVDPFNDPVACQETRCDGTGQCAAQSQQDGTACGIGACGNVCKSGACTPASAADYDDKNPCTNDYCDQGKVVAHEPVTNPALLCDDGDSCTQGDACIAGACQGAPLGCSDGIDCTLDTCAKVGGCQHTPKLDVCTDGNPCTKDACDLAVGCTAVGFEIGTCDDGNACSAPDLCEKGVCKGKPSTDPTCACASDSECVSKAMDLCSVKYKCDGVLGICVPKPDSAVVCDASKDGACRKTACDLTSGGCVTLPIAGSPTCDDGNACTAASYCVAGDCVGTAPADCADNNPCTADGCAGDIGCFHTSAVGPCDDGNLCTENDACQGGACAGSKKPCDDALLCTFDSCDTKTGDCQHLGDPAACNDQNPCTSDTCDLTADCQHAVNDAGACDDGNVCTDDLCKSGKCISVVKCDCAADVDCDDKNPCTTDVCQAGKCVAKAADGNTCSPGDKCQKPGSGTCSGGACLPGNAPVDCSVVADACNAGICDASTGKCQPVAKPAGTACADGDGCTTGDICEGGKCTAGAPLICPPPVDQPCKEAICQSTGAEGHVCQAWARPTGTACDDGLFCTVAEQCDASGDCLGTPFACGSPSTCLLGMCDETQKGCVFINAGSTTLCDDGLYCTVGDACNGSGACTGGAPRVCAGGACLTGVCDEPTDQCLTEATPGCCSTDASCDDGFPCTTDICNAGACAHTSSTICCAPVLWANSFDTAGLEGMTLTNSSGSPALGWQLRANSVFNSGPSALYYGNPAANNFDFGASSGIASTPPIAFPPFLFASGTLSFAIWSDTENGNGYDLWSVSAIATSPTGAVTTTVLLNKPQVATMGAWAPFNVALPTTLQGQSVRFEFSFNTVDAVANGGQGVYLDDISVQVPCL